MNIAIVKSTILNSIRDLRNYLPLCVTMFLLGVMCAMWRDLCINETNNTLIGASLFVSIIALFMSNYFIVENAIRLRAYNKKKLLSEYCARFSSSYNYCKVAEWLLAIAEFDSNGNLIDVHPKRHKDYKGRNITEPTNLERKLFFDYLIELNIQIKNKQLDKEDIYVFFSSYALILKKLLQKDDNTANYLHNLADLSELL